MNLNLIFLILVIPTARTGMSMYYKSPFYETPEIPDCISPPLLEAITRLQPQLCGFNATLLSKRQKRKQTRKNNGDSSEN